MITNTERRILTTLLNSVTRDGDGATVSTTGHEPTDGYMVGGATAELVLTDSSNAAHKIREYVTGTDGTYYGIWRNDDTGHHHVDVSEHYDSREAALTVARIRGEIAVWDLSNGCEVRV